MKRINRIANEGTITVDGKEFHVQFSDYMYEDEPVSKNISSSIDDFYNMMHLIEKAWTNKKYVLVPAWELDKVGFDVRDKDDDDYTAAWISIGEKHGCVEFILQGGSLERRAEEITRKANNSRLCKGVDEDENWVYTELNFAEIEKYNDVKRQQSVVRQWIEEKINPVLG